MGWLPLGEQGDSWRRLPSGAGGARRRRAGRGSFLVRSVSTTTPRGGSSGPCVRPVSCLIQSHQPFALESRRRPAVPRRVGAAVRRKEESGLDVTPGSGKPALWCDAATPEHLRSRACCTRAAPGGKRGEAGTWARGSRGAGASETPPERPSLFGVCRGWGLLAGTARRTSKRPPHSGRSRVRSPGGRVLRVPSARETPSTPGTAWRARSARSRGEAEEER